MPPVAARFVDPEEGFFLGGLPSGRWLMRAIAVERGSEDSLAHVLVGVSEEFDVRPAGRTSADVVLQEPTTGMVPSLLSVPGLDRYLSSLLWSKHAMTGYGPAPTASPGPARLPVAVIARPSAALTHM